MSRTVRIRARIKKYLAERGEANTVELAEYLNSTLTWGVTMQQLGNVLSKDKDIVQRGTTRKGNILGGGYKVMVWGLAPHYMVMSKMSQDELAQAVLAWLEAQGPGEYLAKHIRKGMGYPHFNSRVYTHVADQAPEWLAVRCGTSRGRIYEVLPRT